jgi:hypothetical protein
MDILMIAIVGTLNIACFLIGAKVGQSVAKGKEVEMPKLNPMVIYREQQEKKLAFKEQEKIDAIMRNIDRYDGTSAGQEDIPR